MSERYAAAADGRVHVFDADGYRSSPRGLEAVAACGATVVLGPAILAGEDALVLSLGDAREPDCLSCLMPDEPPAPTCACTGDRLCLLHYGELHAHNRDRRTRRKVS